MRNKRLPFFGALFFVFVFGAVKAQTGQARQNKKQPNIIFILTDDLGYGDIGVFFQNQRKRVNNRSEPWTVTPNLDRMAAGGARLTQHYCGAPVCAPARSSLLLGMSQGHANVRDNQFDKALANNHTLASTLHTLGYATAALGKWGLQGDDRWEKGGDQWPAHPLNRGFDFFFGYMRHSDGHEHYPKEGVYRGAKQVWDNRTEISSQLDKCYTGDLWAARAKKWIIDFEKDNTASKPFFMYLAFDTPHAVLELPTQGYPKGGGLNGGLQWLGKPGQMINTATGTVDSWIHPDYANATYDDDNNPSTVEVPWPDVYKRYATDVRRIDRQVGDLLQLLKDLHIDDNTMVVFSSDNGPSIESYLPENITPDFFNSFGPFDGIKRDCWEGGVRMPTLVRWPGQISPSTVITKPSAHYDWLPTFTDAAGVPAPASADGVSLLPSLLQKGKQQEGLVYIEYFQNQSTPSFKDFAPEHRGRKRNQMQVIRFSDTLGVRYDIKSQADDFDIYNVVTDPQETHNLAPYPGMEDLQKRMKETVLQVRRPDTSAPRPYDGELVPAVPARQLQQGVAWKWFPGTFPWVPSTGMLQPATSGTATTPLTISVKSDKDGVMYSEGFINIPEDGEYTFTLSSTAGAFLRIHDAAVIDEDYGYTRGTERSGTILLAKGLHPFRMTYKYSRGSKNSIDLQWQYGGKGQQPIPANQFYHTSSK